MSAHLASVVRERLLSEPVDLAEVAPDGLRTRVARLVGDVDPLLGAERSAVLIDEIVRDLAGYGSLEALFNDPEVSEIMLNRPGEAYVERQGRLERLDLHLDADAIVRIAERAITPLGLRLDRSSPIVDARLADGSRLHAVIPPLAPDGPCVTIRRFRPQRVELNEFDVTERVGELLHELVRRGSNVLVAGATSAGKTTLLAALARAIDPDERIVTIEETAELALSQPHVVRLEARPANAEGVGATSVRDLVKASLRMRPDRIVVGEVRGGEALDMLQALNTGHDGSLCTIHANDPAAALVRLETLALFGGVELPIGAVRRQVATAIDTVVSVARLRDGRRVLRSVAEVVDIETHTNDDRAVLTRPLVERRDGATVVVGEPTRDRSLQ